MTQIGEPVDSLAAEIGPDPLIGAIIEGKYEIKRLLGQGGMGSVYEGVHRLIGKRVAIKVLHPEFTSSADIVERFQREARAATAIGHPNIVDVTDMGRIPKGGFFQVLELLDGQSFGDLLATTGPIPIARMVKIFSQVADALAAAHDKGIVHRDLKPDNVFLVRRNDEDDFVKLLDFGVAKFLDLGEAGAGGARSGPATRTGMAIGTPQYMSPEQAQGLKTIDRRSDIFALGVMAYEALAGVAPFASESFALVIYQLCTADPAPLTKHRSDVPPELVAIVDRMLAKRPEDRFADCRAVKAALAPFASVVHAPVMSGSASARVSNEETTGATRPAIDAMPAIAKLASSAAPPPPAPITPSTTATPIATESLAPRAPAPQGRAQLAAIGTLAVAVVALGLVVMSSRGTDEPAVIASAPPSITTTEPASVSVSIRTEPPDATLTIDGATVVAPYRATRPRDSAAHVVRAELDGHAPVEQSITFAGDVELTLRLLPIAAPIVAEPAVAEPSAPPASGRGHGHEHGASPSEPPPTTAAPPASTEASETPEHAPPLKRVVF